MTEIDLKKDIDSVVDLLHETQREIKRLTQLKDQLVALVAAHHDNAAGSYKTGSGRKYSVVVPKRLDTDRLAVRYPASDYPTLYRTDLDTGAVRRDVSSHDLAGYYKPGKPQVRL